LPNPALNGRFSVAFALATAEPARLELIDIAGRRVVSRDVGSFGPGRHQIALGDGAHVAPGVYLVRLVQAQSSRTMRAVVIE
ncbi:MAG: T9SS type A sorting domain-containing protein, partial [Gaiellaceae bacterium]